MKYKKIFLPVLAFTATIPVVAAVSCTTSWTKWSPDSPETPVKPVYTPQPMAENFWKIRDASELMLAWDESTSTLDLEKVNNQYELVSILGNILNFSTDFPMDMLYNKYAEMKVYLSGLVKSIPHFKVKYKNDISVEIPWNDITTLINEAIAGIDEYLANPDPSLLKLDLNGQDSEGHDKIVDNQPVDVGGVYTAGKSFMEIQMVSSLLDIDPIFAMEMSKMVNLPAKTFDKFSELLIKIDEFLQQIFESAITQKWVSESGLSFSVSPNNGLKNPSWSASTVDTQGKIEITKGMFLEISLNTDGILNLVIPENPPEDVVIAAPGPTAPSASNEVGPINLNSVNSVGDFMTKLDQEMHIFMPLKYSSMAGPTLLGQTTQLNNIRNYTNGINTNKIFNFTFTKQDGTVLTAKLDFTGVTQWVDKISTILAYPEPSVVSRSGNLSKGRNIGLAMMDYGLPEIAALSGNMVGTVAALGMAGFMELTDRWDVSVPIAERIANHPYIQMLNAYHAAIWKFMDVENPNSLYNEWIKGKTFKLLSSSNVQPGTNYDDFVNHPPTWSPGPYKRESNYPYVVNDSNGHYQISNFEAQFALCILHAYP